MKLNEKQKKVVEAIGDVSAGEFPAIVCPMLDEWIKMNPEEHKEFLEEKFGYKKV